MLTRLTERDTIRRYLRALRREQLLARMERDKERVERLLLVQTIAVDAAPAAAYYSAHAAPLDDMLSLLDRPELRDRVSAISIDVSRLDGPDRELLDRVLTRADAIHQLRTYQPSSLELGQQRGDAPGDLVAGGADFFDGPALGVGEVPST